MFCFILNELNLKKNEKRSAEFLKNCVASHVIPNYIGFRIKKTKLKTSRTIEKAFCSEYINKS